MSPLSSSVYSSIFTYNPYVLISSYQYFTFLASIGPHQITCISHIILALWMKHLEIVHKHVKWLHLYTPTSCQKQTCQPSTKVSWKFDKLFATYSSLSRSDLSAFQPFGPFSLSSLSMLLPCQQHSVTFHCDWTFYYTGMLKADCKTTHTIINTAYPSSLFKYFASFTALAIFIVSCTR